MYKCAKNRTQKNNRFKSKLQEVLFGAQTMALIIKIYIIKVILKKQKNVQQKSGKTKKKQQSYSIKECVVVPNENI